MAEHIEKREEIEGKRSRWVDNAVDKAAQKGKKQSLNPLQRKGLRRVDIG